MQHTSENLVSLRTGDAQELQSVISANLRPAFIKASAHGKQNFHFRQARLKNTFISLLNGEGGIDIRLGVDPQKTHSFIFWVQLKGISWMSPNGKDYFAIPESHACIASNNFAGFIRQSPHSRQFFIRFERALAEDKEWPSPIYQPRTAQRTEQRLLALLMNRLGERTADDQRPDPAPRLLSADRHAGSSGTGGNSRHLPAPAARSTVPPRVDCR